MAGTAEAGLRHSRETTVLADLNAEKQRDLAATLAAFKLATLLNHPVTLARAALRSRRAGSS